MNGPAVAFCLALSILVGCAPSPDSTQAEPPAAGHDATSTAPSGSDDVPVEAARVTRIIDGDTIEVRVGATIERVRLIGVDTPERGQPFARRATAFTAERLPVGAVVFLELDVERRDRYGRLLAYVWREPPSLHPRAEIGTALHNSALLRAGLAVLLTIPPNVRYVDDFVVLQRDARARGVGLWASR